MSSIRRTGSQQACTIEKKIKLCKTDFPSYRVLHYDPIQGQENKPVPWTLSYIGRHFISETAATTTSHEAFLKLDLEVGKDLIESNIAEPYVQKILRGELRKQEGIDADVVSRISETTRGDGDGVGGRISGFFSAISNVTRKAYSSSTLNYTVTYEMVEASQLSACRENVVIFVDKTGKTLFSHNCRNWRNKAKVPHFSRLQGETMNQKATHLLTSGQIDPMIPLTREQTHWYVNIAMPSLISGRDIPEIGVPIGIDHVVGSCGANTSIKSIYLFDNRNSISLNITTHFKREGGSSGTESSQLLIDKRGGHKAWTTNGDPVLLATMASFLACRSNPAHWIETHRLWLDPQGGTLLFYPVNRSAGNYTPVTEIRPKQKPRTIRMPSIDPYSGARPTAKVKRLLYNRVKDTPIDRVTLIINPDQRWEILVKDAPDGKIDVDLIPLMCTQPVGSIDLSKCSLISPLNDVGESMKSYSLDTQELLDCFANFQPTGIGPSTGDPSGILQYLRLDNPAVRTGVGPHKLFRELHNHNTHSCMPL